MNPVEAAVDPTLSLFEVVFCVPSHQKFAVFENQRKRFGKRAEAVRYIEMHCHLVTLGTHLGIFKGTLAEIDADPNRIGKTELGDLEDDYEGKLAHECEWEVMQFDAKTSQFSDLSVWEQFLFPTKEKAIACARFMVAHCCLATGDKRIATTDKARSVCLLQKEI
jgi:hypothetical protein